LTGLHLSIPPTVEVRAQRFPIDDQCSAGAFVLLGPVHQQVEAGMIDVIEVFDGQEEILPVLPFWYL
jgi:hypothetical protein